MDMLYKKLTHKYTLLDLAMVDSTRQLVFTLTEPKPLPTVLTIFNAQAKNYFGLHFLKVRLSIT